MSAVIARDQRQCAELTRYRHADGIAWVGGTRVVVLDLGRPGAVPVALEGSAAWLWHRLDRSTSATALVYSAAEEFDADVEDLTGDIGDFLDRLTRVGLLQQIEDPDTWSQS